MRQETTHNFLPHVSLPQKWKTRLKISSHNHQQIPPPQIMKTNGSFFFKLSSRSMQSWVHSQGPNLGSVSFSLNISSGLISPGRKHPSSSPSLLPQRASGAAFGSGKATAWPRAPAQGPPATHTSVIMQLGPFYFRPIIWSTLTQQGSIKSRCMLWNKCK